MPGGEPLPRISIIFAARDEAEKLPQALATFARLDYPNYEIIAADDRSVDATGAILDAAAAGNANFKAVHIAQLPDGWLGKPHALETAYRESSGEWIVFTDADVRFAPTVLRKALGLMESKGWDHLTILADIDMKGFWEITAIAFFGMGFVLGTRPWRVSNPRSHSYMGVGAFQMVRRSAYEKMGTHQHLRMEVIDDMKLGKLIKESGFRSGLAVSQNSVRVRWHEGFGEIVRGVTKNMFAGFQFKIAYALFAIAGMTLISAALVERRHDPLYQLATSVTNPCDMRRSIELTSLAHRKHYRALEGLESWLRLRFDAIPVSKQRYERMSAPAQKAIIQSIQRIVSPLPLRKTPLPRT